MLLITASSAARCCSALNSRCVSSKRRAFSSATRIAVPSVCSRRQPDADVVGIEDVAELCADEVDDRLQSQLGSEALLDAVDHRQLCGALLLGLEQPLRLVEEARVLERYAHRVTERCEQAHVRSGESM